MDVKAMPVPMATGTFRKMKAATPVSGPRRYSRPNPRVAIPQPIQIAHLYRPVIELTIPTAIDIARNYQHTSLGIYGVEFTSYKEGLWKNRNPGDDWRVSLDSFVIQRKKV
jgi:hypothetical protein